MMTSFRHLSTSMSNLVEAIVDSIKETLITTLIYIIKWQESRKYKTKYYCEICYRSSLPYVWFYRVRIPKNGKQFVNQLYVEIRTEIKNKRDIQRLINMGIKMIKLERYCTLGGTYPSLEDAIGTIGPYTKIVEVNLDQHIGIESYIN